MKKIKHLLAIVVAASLFSCNDATDIIQPGTLNATAAYQTVEDLQLGSLGVYRLLDISDEIGFTSRFTDETRLGFDSGGQGRDLYTFNFNSNSNNPSAMWLRYYRIIREATTIINAASSININSANAQDTVDNIVGQMHAIRAFSHFTMLSYFTTDMTDDTALGVPILDFIPGFNYQPLRNTNGQVFAAIDADLNIAANKITESSILFFNNDAVTALRARIAAYRGQYGIAEPLAQQLLNAYPITTSTSEYQLMFLDQINTEMIFKLERTINDNFDSQGTSEVGGGWLGSLFAFTGPDFNGSPFMEAALDLVNQMDPNDIRRSVNVITYLNGQAPNPVPRDIHIVNKYPGSEGRPLMNDQKVFRSSEMLMILAEARADAGDLAGAELLIEQLQDARIDDINDNGTPTDPSDDFDNFVANVTFANDTDAFGQILDERRIEFAFEGHRYKDLRRLGARGNRTISRDALDCAQLNTCNLPTTDFRFTWPIPFQEIIGNPGLRNQQNSGY